MTKKKTYNLSGGDELRLTCVGPVRVTVEEHGDSNATIADAIETRDAEISRLHHTVDVLRAQVDDGVRADADAIIDRLVERIRR